MAKATPKPAAVAKEKPPATFDWIAKDLRGLAVPIDSIKPDAKNARTHGEENLKAIAASLKKYGQRQPIVVNRLSGEIEAGHARHTAALELGWSHVAVVWVEDKPAAQSGFALADNRSAELAGWNQELLDELIGTIKADNQDLYDSLLLLELESKPADTDGDDDTKAEPPPPEFYEVVVECGDEESQKAFYEQMQKEGRKCRLLTL